MLRRLRTHLSYANVMATIAVFVALGGSSYAALQIGSSDIRDGAVRNRDVARNTLRGSRVAEGSLAKVPRARQADTLGAAGREAVELRCPSGTMLAAGLCFEVTARQAVDYVTAAQGCSAVNIGNRRLPTHAELTSFIGNGGVIDPGGELTSSIAPRAGGGLDVVVILTNSTYTSVTDAEFRPYRCVTTPTNAD